MNHSQASNMNQTFSNRVLLAEFDDNWATNLSPTGYVIYTALKNKAQVEILLADGTSRLVIFPKDGQIFVGGGGTVHFSNPHVTLTI